MHEVETGDGSFPRQVGGLHISEEYTAALENGVEIGEKRVKSDSKRRVAYGKQDLLGVRSGFEDTAEAQFSLRIGCFLSQIGIQRVVSERTLGHIHLLLGNVNLNRPAPAYGDFQGQQVLALHQRFPESVPHGEAPCEG